MTQEKKMGGAMDSEKSEKALMDYEQKRAAAAGVDRFRLLMLSAFAANVPEVKAKLPRVMK